MVDGKHGVRPVLRHMPSSARQGLHQRSRDTPHRRSDLPRSCRVQPAAVLALPSPRDAVRLAAGERDPQRHGLSAGQAGRLPLFLLLKGVSVCFISDVPLGHDYSGRCFLVNLLAAVPEQPELFNLI